MKTFYYNLFKIFQVVILINITTNTKVIAEPLPHEQIGIPEIALSGFVVKNLIQEFEEAGSRLIFEGENRGNALLTALGNQIRVSTQNASLAMKDQQDILFDNLDLTQQTFFTQLNTILRESNQNIDRAISVLEIANLNLIELTNRLPLTEKVYTYINKIDGLMQPHQTVPYQIKIFGLGMGQNLPNAKYATQVIIEGKEVPSNMISREPPYSMTINLSPDFLEPFYNNSSMKFLDINIKTVVDYTQSCWYFFSCEDQITSDWDLKMTLLPRFPGEVSGEELLTGEVLDGVTKTTSVTVTTSNCEANRPCDWVREIPLPDNVRVTNVRYACSGQCGWSYNLRKGGYEPDYDILDGKVVVYRHVDGESPTTVTYYVDYQTLKPIVERRPIKPIKMRFGDVFQLPLSEDNLSCSYFLRARLTTGQEVFIDNSMSQSPDGLLVRISVGTGPISCTPTFSLNLP